tara:strand:+ start:276 stop:662 length:387 start_codon:yes stop_codon:yes gene_type:complete
MAVEPGREFLVKKGGTAILGAQETSISIDSSPVNVTDMASAGFRTLANFAGERSLDIACNGIWEDNVFRNLALGADSALLLSDVTVVFADAAVISGNFLLASYEETGSYDGAVQFTCSLQSSGTWTLS